jgi:hypothetical protein
MMSDRHVVKERWYQDRLTALFGVVISLVVVYFSYSHYAVSSSYEPMPQQVFLDVMNRPIGLQDLLQPANHNPQYRKDLGDSGTEGVSAADFSKEALLTVFKYNKKDLQSGKVLANFRLFMSEEHADKLYTNIFTNLSQQRVVIATDGHVRARLIGELEYVGSRDDMPYESRSGLTLTSIGYMFKGKMVLTAHGADRYPTIYDVTLITQRALIQDKIKGYQITDLVME